MSPRETNAAISDLLQRMSCLEKHVGIGRGSTQPKPELPTRRAEKAAEADGHADTASIPFTEHSDPYEDAKVGATVPDAEPLESSTPPGPGVEVQA